LLFVYGSLKRGGRHHAELRGAPFRGLARTEAGYRVVRSDQGGYLALIEQAGAAGVDGELFEVTAPLIALLDEFEGDGYQRETIRVRPGEGQKSEICFALAYLKRTR
jgi:gamma-glutamylcyclotransferase (GGCT)/AIG2-like uncharacterized protein YtfP